MILKHVDDDGALAGWVVSNQSGWVGSGRLVGVDGFSIAFIKWSMAESF